MLISKEKVTALREVFPKMREVFPKMREVFAKIAEEASAAAGKAAGREAAIKAVQQITIETAAKVCNPHLHCVFSIYGPSA